MKVDWFSLIEVDGFSYINQFYCPTKSILKIFKIFFDDPGNFAGPSDNICKKTLRIEFVFIYVGGDVVH